MNENKGTFLLSTYQDRRIELEQTKNELDELKKQFE